MDQIQDLTRAIENKIDRSTWKTWKFSDLAENIIEKVVPKDSGLKHYIGLEHLDSGSLHIKRFGETASLVGDKLKIYKGDLIFAKRNAYLKRVAIAEFDAVASAHSMVLRAKPENILPEFLPFFMLSETFWEKAIEISVGSLSPTINWSALAKQEFLLPPKDQQAQMAVLLWAMDEIIEKELELNFKLENFFKVYRKSFMENGIYQKEGNYKKLRFGKVYQHWPIQKLASFCKLIGGNAFNSSDFKGDGKYQVLRIGNLTSQGFDFSKSPVFKDELCSQELKSLIPKDAIVLSLTGTNGKRDYGFPSFMMDHNRYLLNQRLVMLIADHEKILPRFLFVLTKMELFQGKFFLNATGTANQANVSIQDVAKIELPLPPIKEQKEIITKLDSIESCFSNSKIKISTSKAIQKSLINQIF